MVHDHLPDGTRVQVRRLNGDILTGSTLYYKAFDGIGEYYHIMMDNPVTVIVSDNSIDDVRMPVRRRKKKSYTASVVNTHGLYSRNT